MWLLVINLLLSIAHAVSANVEEFSDILLNNRPPGVDLGLFPAGPIVIAENFDILVLSVLSEHGVHKEDRGLELRVVLIDGLVVLLVVRERLKFGRLGE